MCRISSLKVGLETRESVGDAWVRPPDPATTRDRALSRGPRGATVRTVQDERVAPSRHVPALNLRDPGISPPTGLRAAFRALRPLVGVAAIDAAGSATPLERFAMAGDPPAVASCIPLESSGPHTVSTDASPEVAAFLDGVQRSRVVGHIADSPLVLATVGAVIQERADRRLITWRDPALRVLLLASRVHVGDEHWEALEATGLGPIDVSDPGRNELPLHPLAVRARALEFVAQEREALERRVAAEWCRTESRWLWIDGGISGNLAIDAATAAFGVVKSHTTLYGDAAALRSTLRLSVGERSALFLVQHRARRAVASWYLRMHTGHGGDPLHGLLRVEVAPPSTLFHPNDTRYEHPDAEAVQALAQRADDISAWMLAERAPIALPDARWDTLTYGVYACEQFLKAVIGA